MNLKKLRERANLRTMDVAVALDAAESSVRNWEQGRSMPRLDQVRQLLKLYDCSFEELCDALDANPKKPYIVQPSSDTSTKYDHLLVKL